MRERVDDDPRFPQWLEGPDRRYLGRSQIVNADGSTVAQGDDKRGVVIGEIEIGR